MRTSTLTRGGALLTAATLALSLGAGPATADSSQTEKAATVKSPTGATSAPSFSFGASARTGGVTALANPGQANIISFDQKHVVLYTPGTYVYHGNPKINYEGSGLYRIRTRLYVGGKNQGFFDMSPYGIQLPSTVQSGHSRLGPSNLYYSGSPTTSDTTKSNYFNIRRYTTSTNTYGLLVTRVGSHITFKAQNWKIFKPSTGKYVAMNTMKLQYRKDGHWVTWKTISLNDNGTGSYSTKTNTHRRYRLAYPTTDSILGSHTEATGSI
ncbi:hypothetical protein [Aeromicrobium sp. 9AM]|uniref:hypothetical protein n=1 Tax=Aeromicrobium sp. 9AM TaxID=2653126 RepID=UPI0012F20907|nr:hypothetical protein [Aeromicrobium sp. 9AM]VXC39012.1 conserved exported hypothetical protein [Aeromicrobium sp. 9AM]